MKLDKCPRCGFDDVVEKNVEKLLRGGGDVAAIVVPAHVCLHCGERTYSLDTVIRFEYIQDKLANRQVDDFQPMGRLFRVPTGYGERESEEKGKEMLKSFSSTPPDKTP